jgi:hypothetical protein
MPIPFPPQDGNRIYIVLEFCTGGDLGNYIRRYGRVSESTARYFLQQLAEGLKELRKHNVVHVREAGPGLVCASLYSSSSSSSHSSSIRKCMGQKQARPVS